MAPFQKEDLLPRVREIAWAAGAETLKYYRGDYAVRRKEDSSPVTEADDAAEAIIVPALEALTPDVPIVAEEMMSAGGTVDVAGRSFWLVDPLDGTREFVEHRAEFTVNIALIEDRRPVLGVVYAPAVGVTYTGCGPGTAKMIPDGEAARAIAVRPAPKDGLVVTASRHHGDSRRLEALLKTLKVKEIRIAGSSIKFCLIAAGEADLYPRYGPTSEWDTAAGHAVLLAAGGSVRLVDGSSLLYGKIGFRNPEFIARGGE